jgi:L-amino acid N-acyltransferase YncA
MISIRLASAADAKNISDIYAPYIKNTSLTFELEVPTQKQFAERIEKYLLEWPWLVCEVDGIIAGYAYASRYRERAGYQWSCECSVYIHDNYLKRAIAQSLYAALTEILEKQGYRNVYAVINLPNDKSVALHEKCGFKWMATYEKVGYKLGKWKDVGWWVKILNEYSHEPEAPIPFEILDKEFLPELFFREAEKIRY